MASSVKIEVKDKDILEYSLDKLRQAPEKAMKKMTSDARKQVKKMVASEISKAYGVDESDISSKKLGTVRAKGKILDSLEFIYRGRSLTPTHFSMSPRSPRKEGYVLSAEILRGKRATLGNVRKLTDKQRAKLARNLKRKNARKSKRSPIMLLPTGNKQEGGMNYIPFQRVSRDRKDIKAIKTLSMPQMVSGERAGGNISTAVNNKMQERTQFYLGKYIDKI